MSMKRSVNMPAHLPNKMIVRVLALFLLFILSLQNVVLASGTEVPLYLDENGQKVLLSASVSDATLYDSDRLLMIRRTLACVEADPQIVTLSGRGTAEPTLSMTPEYPDCFRSTALAERVADIAAASRKGDGFQNQILYISEAIRETTQYDIAGVKKGELKENRCAYGALINGLATCEGYANAFLLVCKAAYIPCVRVLGYRGGVYHTWNAVYDGSSWYMCDLTEGGFLLLPEDDISRISDFSGIEWEVYGSAKAYRLGRGLSLDM